MKTDKYLDANFKKNKTKVSEINEHFEGCNFRSSSIPINDCPCECYDKQVFAIGMRQGTENFYT